MEFFTIYEAKEHWVEDGRAEEAEKDKPAHGRVLLHARLELVDDLVTDVSKHALHLPLNKSGLGTRGQKHSLLTGGSRRPTPG